ncbi:MAG: pyrroline-5-carboxylate reductase [Candidatus Magasanikbacteria bacterium RIFOXYD2_FULL_41_14]|uniref:Pyrroline-5-carboxylate reductase n=1 Tax=Candidatus Magasanikbacteria bacterium RIFOXYD2_FULL_41_14 TaxID=1798709 RepID=A0A1F6PF46_9BACT|nr:MAG: pyrroline-5-carboxylate reductase [Candidatus Magasanikbacteria bacterium RIFOXYD2_FULL_41_14]
MFKKIGIIGAGVMGEVFISRLLMVGINAKNIIATAPDLKRLRNLNKKYKIDVSQNNADAFKNADLIILAVKPQQAEVALGNLPKAKIDQVFLSIMTGVSIKKISNLVNSKKVARVMPNTPARIGSGMSVWTAAGLFKAEKSFIKRILQSLGQELEVSSEDLIDKATAVSGSGPAYVFDFASHLIVAAQELGFNEKQARQLVGQTIIGAGSLLIMSEESASDLRKKVTSKGGTTEAAFKVIDKAKLNKIYSKALKVAYKRARELRGGI